MLRFQIIKKIAHEDLKQPVSTETLDEELPDKKQEQPKATIIPLSVKRELSEEGVTESMKSVNQLAWVGAMNNIRNRAKEIAIIELIYC